MGLNIQQAKVATSDVSRAIILAGAGTGKTASAVHWIATQVQKGTDPKNILMVTFTKKAAMQMRDRLAKLIGVEAKTCNIGTYHAIASKLIRMDPIGFGMKDRNFTILDQSDSLGLVRSAFRITGYKAKAPLAPAKILSIRSYSVNTRKSLHECLGVLENCESEVKTIIEHYNHLKGQANALDYDDLLLAWLTRMQKDANFQRKLAARFACTLVDEFQDNNLLNYEIIQTLNPAKLMVIGDKQQSIYAFRGSHSGLVDQFMQAYPDAEVIKLEDNYRSGQIILDLANDVICTEQHALRLQSATGRESQLVLKPAATIKQEAANALEVIQKMLRKFVPSEICILCRASRGLLPIEFLLRKNRITYKKYGGVAITDSAEIKDFLAILRVLNNPKDSVAIMRAMCLFPGIGETFAARFAGLADKESPQEFMDLGEKEWPLKAKELHEWINQLQKLPSLGEKGEQLFEFIAPLIIKHYPEDHAERMHSLQEIVGIMKAEESPLSEFLEIFVLDRGFEKEHPKTDITLSTIHSAKGLEWDGVLVFAAAADVIPSKMCQSRDEIEEEKRLMYVAVTRARVDLVVSYNYEQNGATPFLEPYQKLHKTKLDATKLPLSIPTQAPCRRIQRSRR